MRISCRPRSSSTLHAVTGTLAQSRASSRSNRVGWLSSTGNTKWAFFSSVSQRACVRCVCIASALTTRPVRSSGVNNGTNAVISLLLHAIWHWASTTPVHDNAPSRCGAGLPALFAPRLVLPSTAICGNRGRCRSRALARRRR